MRKLITSIIGVILIGFGLYLFNTLSANKKRQIPRDTKVIPTVFIQEVQNQNVPITIIESGRLVSKNRIELFSEVQGVMEQTKRVFKPGEKFKKGEIIVHIRSDDFYANLQAQKSNLQNLITSILPDLRLDFPDAYEKWDKYIREFDIQKPVVDLPEPSSEKEKFFITGRNIYSTYYNTKNSEIIYQKYNLRAPFDGILTDASVTPGTLVRQGQRLGEFIDPSIYEMEVSVSKTMIQSISVGKKVKVVDPESKDHTWDGEIVRINGKVDQATQTVQVFIDVKGNTLREGMYLEAHINGEKKENAFEFSRNLLVNERYVYVVLDGKLVMKEVEPIHYTQKTVVVRGIEDGEILVSTSIPGAYEGMEVNIFKAS